MAPTIPNANVTLEYRYLNAAWIRWGLSSGHTHYRLRIEEANGNQELWDIEKNVVEKEGYCKFDLGRITIPTIEHSTTYKLSVRGVNHDDGTFSNYTTPATLTTGPELPTLNVYQSVPGAPLVINLNFTTGTPWTRAVCNVLRDGIFTEKIFNILSSSTSYSVTDLPQNKNYQVRVWTEYDVNSVSLESKDKDGETAVRESSMILLQGPRPFDFTWHSPKVAEEQFNLTHIEWNGYLQRLADFTKYLYGDDWLPEFVDEGDVVLAEHMNNIVQRLFLNGAENISATDFVFSGFPIKADLLNKIVTEMNDF